MRQVCCELYRVDVFFIASLTPFHYKRTVANFKALLSLKCHPGVFIILRLFDI